MPTLSKEYRKQLEKVVLAAREEAESGAAAALESYGVGEARKPAHLDKGGEDLRKKLRAHGRQLGDLRRPDESQELHGLIHETAYQHWHRMLFARFLAENGFLIEPESGLDVDLDYCEERARETNGDMWEIAAGFAQRMLTAIFRPDDPVLQLRLPAESRNRLTALLASLPAEVFTASDSLGWVYQFWQAKKKEEVNHSGVKIGADELPAVTQLFTEDYMVDFLLDNTVGAWHAGRVLAANPGLAGSAGSEEELRQAVALPGVPWSYLRFVKGEDGRWTPAAGAFDGWPKAAKDLTCLDPCMGSGHFVVAMFERLVALRMAGEGLDEAAAVAAVIRENLYGLEIDPRCTQIAAFNLALAGWRRVGHCRLPAMNLACSGLAPNTREADWVAIAGDNQKLKHGMERLYRLFQKASVLGSLINPRAGEGDLLVAAFHELQPLLEKALAQEAKDDNSHEMAIAARGVAKAAEILAGQFTLVATNVPYLGRGKQDDVLMDHCGRVHPDAKADLATCLVERCLELCSNSGSAALVTPQNWLFLGTYKKLRLDLLKRIKWEFVVRLGEKGFESAQAAGAFTSLLIFDSTSPAASHAFSGLDVVEDSAPNTKALSLSSKGILLMLQSDQLNNPDQRIVLGQRQEGEALEEYADCSQGIMPADRGLLIRYLWEVPSSVRGKWKPLQSSSNLSQHYSGLMSAFDLQTFEAKHKELGSAYKGTKNWNRSGVCISQMRSLPVTLYLGSIYDGNIDVVVPRDPILLPSLWCFFQTGSFESGIRKLEQKLDINTGTILKVPFELAHWQKVAAEKYPNGLPKPYSSDPTQWLFNGHPAGADQPLHVAVARLLGYQWPRQTGSSFPDCPALEPDGLEKHADQDGIVCFSQARDEPPAADRLRALLADAYGAEWSHALERKLIADTGAKAASLEYWLLNDFFAQHCALFHHRPFAWHLWDGRKDGFNALVNYHRLAGPNGEGHRTLETLTHAHLGDWITRQRDAVARAEAGADDRLAAAQELQGELKKIEAGEPPYDLFVRWKPLRQQAIGWHPDINDGVRLNCRPFVLASLTRGKRGAGLFRAKFNVKWEKDRGKEPQRPKKDYPWFWTWDEQAQDFAGGAEPDGNRWNDCHYTTTFKRAARERGTT